MTRRRAIFLTLAVLALATIQTAAQAPEAARAQLQSFASPAPPAGWPWSLNSVPPGCPLGFRAQRGSGSGLVVTHGFPDHGPMTGIAQQLHITFTNRRPSSIVGVTLTAHGLTAAFRMTPTVQSAAAPDSGTITRTVHLDLTLNPRANVSADLALAAFTSVTRIDLVAIDYADGSNWHASPQQTCHVEPDGLMLVASH